MHSYLTEDKELKSLMNDIVMKITITVFSGMQSILL